MLIIPNARMLKMLACLTGVYATIAKSLGSQEVSQINILMLAK